MKVTFAFVHAAFRAASIYRLDYWVFTLGIFIMMYASYSIWSILYQQSPDAFGMGVDFGDDIADVAIDRAELLVREGRRARFRFNRWHTSASALITQLAKCPVRDISIEEPEIEAIVREIYRRSSAGGSMSDQHDD